MECLQILLDTVFVEHPKVLKNSSGIDTNNARIPKNQVFTNQAPSKQLFSTQNSSKIQHVSSKRNPQISSKISNFVLSIDNLNSKVGTAIHEATLAGKSDCVLYLLDEGGDFHVRNKFFQVPLELVDQFVENRGSPEQQGSPSNSCLQCRELLLFAEELKNKKLPMRAFAINTI